MGARLIELPIHSDRRGNLTVIEDGLLPFRVQRQFCIWGVPWIEKRANHANRTCHQFLWPISGAVSVKTDEGSFCLHSPHCGLYIEPMTWLTLWFAGPDTRLMVLASHSYDPDDHITDYTEFLREKGLCK